MDNNDDKVIALSSEIMNLASSTILVKMRFFGTAISKLKPVPYKYFRESDFSIATDGNSIAYSPRFILQKYKTNKESVFRMYLHVVLHCVFRHQYVSLSINKTLWDLACDMSVESMIGEMNEAFLKSIRYSKQTIVISDIKKYVTKMTPEKIYRYLLGQKMTSAQLQYLSELFVEDDHFAWYIPSIVVKQTVSTTKITNGDSQGNSENNDSQGNDNKDSDGNGDSDDFQEGGETKDSRDAHSLLSSPSAEDEEDWKTISHRIQVDMETINSAIGRGAGSLTQSIMELNREKYDYSAFLKRFAVLGEAMRNNDDEFDYIYYAYGLQHYGKMPLIEPLEYKEVKLIKDFVIVIDTSGSVQGDLVQLFVQKTYNILLSEESFFSKINIHIIQCDTKIQEHVKITSQEEFAQYISSMTLKGFGGTDFRPAFTLVNELIAEKEFDNLKGIIYFTDGYGIFPEYKPTYETAFVFCQENFCDVAVPPWAIKLILLEEDI